jgi:predicted kinase
LVKNGLTTKRLILFCGPPGSGKTTVARLVARAIKRSFHVQTDEVRAMLSSPKFTGDESRMVYEAATVLAGLALDNGYNAIIDATFPREEFRREALTRLRGRSDAELVVCLVCDLATARRRNASRRRKVPSWSFERLHASFETPEGALVIDTSKLSAREVASLVLARLRS